MARHQLEKTFCSTRTRNIGQRISELGVQFGSQPATGMFSYEKSKGVNK
jgi:hypothetical protein